MRIRWLAAIIFTSLPWACSRPTLVSAPAAAIREEEVRFSNGDISLAGTLFLPAGKGVHPGVVLFHGSGPQERDSWMARWFAEQGVAALAYDKRGVGGSSGDFRVVPFTTLVEDGIAGVAFLKTRAEVRHERIGVWGLSQGGWLGPLAASQSKDVAFVIAVSGPGVSPGEQMIFYYASQLRNLGIPEDQVDGASDLRRTVWHYLSTGEGYAQASEALQQAESKPWFVAVREQQDGLFKVTPVTSILNDDSLRARLWFKSEMLYDPRFALRKLSVPSLFLFGERDELVPVRQSVEIIGQTLRESHNKDFTIQTFPEADHEIRIRTPQGGSRFAAGYLETTSRWVHARTER